MNFFVAFENVLVLFLLILIGFFVGKKNIVREYSQQDLTNLVVYVTLPATIISSMMREITMNELKKLTLSIILVFISYFVMYFISKFIVNFYKIDKAKKDIFLTASFLCNASFMGYPIVENLLGKNALFYAVITQGFVMEIIAWGFAINIIARNINNVEKTKIDFKKILTRPGIIAIFIGLFFLFTQLKLPMFLNQTLNIISKTTSPLAMILIGIMLSRTDIKLSIKNPYFYITSFIKLLIAPLVIFIIFSLFNVNTDIIKVAVIEFAMPTAAYVSILSANVKNDHILASEQVFISSLLSIITIPFIVFLLLEFS